MNFVDNMDQIIHVSFSTWVFFMFLVPLNKYFVENCIFHAYCMGYRTVYLVILDLLMKSMSLFIDIVSTIKCYGFKSIVKVLIIYNYINTCLVCSWFSNQRKNPAYKIHI